MSENSADDTPKIRELLGRATLARAHHKLDEALALARQAASLEETSWESHELVGDLLMEKGEAEAAMASYRRARKIAVDRPLLEDKIARAALRQAADQTAARRTQALLDGTARPDAPKRNPGYAALFSFVIPGLGQVYNGEILKGLILLVAYVALFSVAMLSALQGLSLMPRGGTGPVYGPSFDVSAILGAVFDGVGLIWMLLLIGLWVYAIADAALRASKGLTSDDSGLV
jgi:TM2 domain-containing membrane protein YozV